MSKFWHDGMSAITAFSVRDPADLPAGFWSSSLRSATQFSDGSAAALHRVPPGADAAHALVIALDHL